MSGIATDVETALENLGRNLNEVLWEVVKRMDVQNRILEYLVLLLAKKEKERMVEDDN